ncbi:MULTISPECIES: cytochrome c oxidase subunit 3 [Nocardia]|uniref:cytochrome c oxidase subunit 3 n=1 Tax=Nocardia TaxID=1817 RepID=UPI000D68DB57|nr:MULTISPECIES: cytochrome c oxidase subunit 3 [Nocardia]
MTLSAPETRPAEARRSRHLPGDIDMWVMILGDLFFFGAYFVVYMVFRTRSADEFSAAQQHLDIGIGVANTVVLLTSSMFVALAVIAVRERAIRSARQLELAAAACGLIFTLVKIFEWHREISNGHTVSEEFFSFYFVLTGVHLAHLLLGMLILGIVVRELRDTAEQRVGIVEQGALFWHMIDLLWVVIFAIVYLMR